MTLFSLQLAVSYKRTSSLLDHFNLKDLTLNLQMNEIQEFATKSKFFFLKNSQPLTFMTSDVASL